jgi:hypothetical protein
MGRRCRRGGRYSTLGAGSAGDCAAVTGDDGAALWADTFNEDSSACLRCRMPSAAYCGRAGREFGQQVPQKLPRLGTSDAEAYEHISRAGTAGARFTSPRYATSIDAPSAGQSRAIQLRSRHELGLASVQFHAARRRSAPKEFYPTQKRRHRRPSRSTRPRPRDACWAGCPLVRVDWAASEAHFRGPSSWTPTTRKATQGYAHLLSVTGRHAQALAEVRRARKSARSTLWPPRWKAISCCGRSGPRMRFSASRKPEAE